MRTVLTLNGAPAAADDLRLALTNNYGHFTAMRVTNGAVRGLDLHLQRLALGTRELFASDLDTARVRAWLRQAVAGLDGLLSARVNVFSRAFDRGHPGAAAVPDVLISVGPAPLPSGAIPLRLKSFRYGRELPHVKHVGTFPLFHFRALAQRAGFDDALFAGDDGLIAEASIWNIGFFDGTRIVWPQAPQLAGISMRLLRAGCVRLGVPCAEMPVPLADVASFRAAFLTNASVTVQAVCRIDAQELPRDEVVEDLLRQAFASNPLQAI